MACGTHCSFSKDIFRDGFHTHGVSNFLRAVMEKGGRAHSLCGKLHLSKTSPSDFKILTIVDFCWKCFTENCCIKHQIIIYVWKLLLLCGNVAAQKISVYKQEVPIFLRNEKTSNKNATENSLIQTCPNLLLYLTLPLLFSRCVSKLILFHTQ